MLTIRTAGVADIPELRKLVYQVWPQTYESILPAEKITYMLKLMRKEIMAWYYLQGYAAKIIISGILV